MRIAFDAAPLLHSLTGVGHYTLHLLEHLLASDESLDIDLWMLSLRGDRSRIPNNSRLRVKHLRFPARVTVRLWERIGRPKGESIFGAADVFHGTNYWIPPLKDKKGVVTIHDLTFQLYPELCTAPVRRYRWMMPRVLERCSFVIAPSETIRSQIVEHLGFPSERVAVTAEGVDGRFADARPNPGLLERFGLTGDYVLFVGTKEPRKNLTRLIKSMQGVSQEVTLVIAGPPGWGADDLPQVIESSGLKERVRILDYIEGNEVAALMASAKAFVFPTLYEGFGLPPLEAMAAGIPVVASTAGSLPEVLGDAPFYCDPLDVGSIGSAIQSAVTEGETRSLAITRGFEIAGKYDWGRTARSTLEVYEKVANEHV